MIGRDVNYGAGKEVTAGTAVAATQWFPYLSFELAPKTKTINNESAYGNIVRTNETSLLGEWSEGELEAKLATQNAGMILLGAFGTVVNSTNADTSAAVFNHTYTINQNVNGQSLTFVKKDSIETLAYALGRVDEWQLSMELDDYVKYTAKILAKKQVTTTATVAYPTDLTEFVAKHMSVKTATTEAGLAAASNISSLESFTLTVKPNLEADWQAGTSEPYAFSSRGYELEFEMECRYNDTVYKDAYRNGTTLALQITALNTDVTIGTSARPGLVITAPRMNITDWAPNGNIDDPITQTMTGVIHFSPVAGKAITAVLTDTTAAW